jgi:DNA-binding NarL/FixJ family response regulator
MENMQVYKRTLDEKTDNLNNQNSERKYYPISFLREMKFFFDISYDDVNRLLIEVEKIKESKKLKIINLDKLASLTAREMEVFDLVVKGFSTKKIAKELFVQALTISTHRKRIKEKLEFKTLYDWFLLAKSIQ